MRPTLPYTFRVFLAASIFLALIGWAGLVSTVLFLPPLVWPRWLFFALLTMALTGTALPVVYFFHLRFPAEVAPEPGVILRQAIWVGVYGASIVWMWRVLTLPLGMGIAAGIVVIEWMLRMAERSAWRPPQPDQSQGGPTPVSEPDPDSEPDSPPPSTDQPPIHRTRLSQFTNPQQPPAPPAPPRED
jgi:hypothetical protein